MTENVDATRKRIGELKVLIQQKQQRLSQIDQEKNQITVDIIGMTGAVAELEKLANPTPVVQK